MFKSLRAFLLPASMLMATMAQAQSQFFMSAAAGVSGYRGDLGAGSWGLTSTRPMAGFGVAIELNHRLLVRGEMLYGKVAGSDQFSVQKRSRNLSFESKLTEFSLLFEYVLFDLCQYKVSPYFFGGAGTFKFSPYTSTAQGKRVFLAEQSTEGQGFYKDRKPYKLQELALPFGGGLQWALSHNKRIALEMGLRKTFTDYLDDVSTTYIDANLLSQQRGGTAVRLAYRGAELPNAAPYPADGSIRGNPNNKDWYLFTGVSFRFSLQPKGRERHYEYHPRRSPLSCPKPF